MRNFSEASFFDNNIMKKDRQVFLEKNEEYIKNIVEESLLQKRISKKDILEYTRCIYAVVFGAEVYLQKRKTRKSILSSKILFTLAGAKFCPSSKFKAYYNKLMNKFNITPKFSKRRII